MKFKPTYVFAGGGTGGHIYPAIAIAQEVQSRIKNARIVFVGSHDRLEKDIVPKYGFEFYPIEMKGIKRSLAISNVRALMLTYAAISKSKILLRELKPKYVIGTGGYISLPVLFAARQKYNTLIHEQNVYPGLATKLLAKYATSICVSFEDTRRYLRARNNMYLTGNPIRKGWSQYNKNESLKQYGLDSEKPVILILGGSLGSSAINKAVLSNIDKILDSEYQVIWQTGGLDYERLSSLCSNYQRLRLESYIDDIYPAYYCSDLVVCRAGATTIAELACLQKAAILVPYTLAARDHQRKNSYMLESAGAVKVLEERDLPATLSVEIHNLVYDSVKRKQLSQNIEIYGRPYAASKIVDLIVKY